MTQAPVVLDVRGLSCPWPALRLRNCLETRLADGGVARLLSDDRRALRDLRAFCDRTGHELLAANEGEGGFEIWIRKRAGRAA